MADGRESSQEVIVKGGVSVYLSRYEHWGWDAQEWARWREGLEHGGKQHLRAESNPTVYQGP